MSDGRHITMRNRLEHNVNPQIMIRCSECFPNSCRRCLVLIAILLVVHPMTWRMASRPRCQYWFTVGLVAPARYLSPSLRSHLSSAMLSLALIIPIRSNSPFPPLFCYGEESPSGKKLKKDRVSRPLDRSTEGRRTLSQVPSLRLTVCSFSIFLSFSLSLCLFLFYSWWRR